MVYIEFQKEVRQKLLIEKGRFMDFFNRSKDVKDIQMLSPLVWAYVGDGVYIESIKYVKAGAQFNILEKITDKLTEEELDIVRRGRNVDNHHLPKNSNIAEYSYSTGFEALLGYLYLSKQDERLEEILKMCID